MLALLLCSHTVPIDGQYHQRSSAGADTANAKSMICPAARRSELPAAVGSCDHLLVRNKSADPPGVHWSSAVNMCVNLAPAGTGTTTLSQLMKRVSHHAHHDHTFGLGQQPPAGCLVVTLRDPVERLTSGWKFRWRQALAHRRKFGYAGHSTFRGFLQVARNVSEGGLCDQPGGSKVARKLADWFGVSVVDYLINLNCSMHEVHYICTDQLQRDWVEFLQRRGVPRTATSCPELIKMPEHSNMKPDASVPGIGWDWPMAEEDKHFVRECMFPEDTHLYNKVCGIKSRDSEGTRVQAP